jgi:hypothetical protein
MTLDLEAEWQRVRVDAGVTAADRYSWLRPADPREVTVRRGTSSELQLVRRTSDRQFRSRALRVDESRAVLDVQFAVDAIHWYERRQPTLCFFFDPATKHVSLQPSDHAWRLEVTRSRQVLGERVWWRCPVCGRRRRFLYHFVVAAAGEPRPVLGCRTCLGLTYPSRARHRCPDQDRRAAADGDEAAADRIRRREAREAHRFEVACERDVALVTAFRRRIVSMAKEMEEANPRRDRAGT